MRKLIVAAIAVAAFAGCEAQVQTTSGAEYLARYDAQAEAARRIGESAVRPADLVRRAATGPRARADIDPAIRAVAEVEPILQFPARIGLARIEGSTLTGIPPDEAALWHGLAEAHRTLGTFVPVEPLVAYTAARPWMSRAADVNDHRYRDSIAATIDTIRLGAARQHLDAVLIYAVGQRGGSSGTVLSVLNLTIIGAAILPTREIEIEGLARALLMDVRNGYPYGTASASVDLSEYSPAFGSDARTEDLRREAVLKVTEALIPEVEAMLAELTRQMLVRRAAK